MWALACVQAVTRVLRWQRGVDGVLSKLRSGDGAKIVDALRHIIAQAIRANPRFLREFHRCTWRAALHVGCTWRACTTRVRKPISDGACQGLLHRCDDWWCARFETG